jgi:MFS family permease
MASVRTANEAGPRSRSAWVTGSLAFAVAVVALTQTSSIPLLPALSSAFDTSIASVSWVATSTLVVGAAVNPAVGRMGDMYGKRILLLGCLVATVAGSVIGALAGSLALVIAARALQGIGAGVIPLAYGMLRDELPSHVLGRAVSVVTGAGAGLGAGLGPVVMGAVVATHGWRAVFWCTVVLCVTALALVAAATRGRATRSPARFDVTGAVVLATVLVVVLLGISRGAEWGWTSLPVVTLMVAGGALGVWWVRWERTRLDPLVDLGMSGRGPVLLAHLGGVMVGAATFTQYITSFTLVSLPVETGHGLGRGLAVAGLVQLPGAVVLLAAVLLASRIGAAHGSLALLQISAAIITAGFGLALVWHGSLAEVVLSVTVVSAGLGIGFCALPVLILEHVDRSQTAAVNGLNALARVIGSVLASALVTAVMASGIVTAAGQDAPAEWTFLVSYAIGMVPALAVGGIAWRSRRRAPHALASSCCQRRPL